jgi:transcriptional regulator with XRE-family HTH domain
VSRKEETPLTTVGANLRRIRKSKRVTQPELAKLSGVAQGGISAIETGHREPFPSTLEKLADALEVPTAEFFADDTTGRHPPLPPRLPLTTEPEGDYDGRLAATDAKSAEALREKMDAEFTTQQEYIQKLKAAGVDDFRLRQARFRLAEAKRRLYATTTRANDLGLNAEFGQDRPVFDTVEAYVGRAEKVDAFYGEEEARSEARAHPEAG